MQYETRNIPNYPNDGKHLQIVLEPGISIYLGLDIVYFTNHYGSESKTDKKHWWVMDSHPCITRPKKFVDHYDAVKYAYSMYLSWCKKESKRVTEILKTM